jgi:hypothetical protein
MRFSVRWVELSNSRKALVSACCPIFIRDATENHISFPYPPGGDLIPIVQCGYQSKRADSLNKFCVISKCSEYDRNSRGLSKVPKGTVVIGNSLLPILCSFAAGVSQTMNHRVFASNATMLLPSSVKVRYQFHPTTSIVTGPHRKFPLIVWDVEKNPRHWTF